MSTAFTDARDSTCVPVMSSVRCPRSQGPIAHTGSHVIGPKTALSGPVTVAYVLAKMIDDGCGGIGQHVVGQDLLRAVR